MGGCPAKSAHAAPKGGRYQVRGNGTESGRIFEYPAKSSEICGNLWKNSEKMQALMEKSEMIPNSRKSDEKKSRARKFYRPGRNSRSSDEKQMKFAVNRQGPEEIRGLPTRNR